VRAPGTPKSFRLQHFAHHATKLLPSFTKERLQYRVAIKNTVHTGILPTTSSMKAYHIRSSFFQCLYSAVQVLTHQITILKRQFISTITVSRKQEI
jgi:hypothetical protein